jgi:hypothetical protein
MPENHCRPASRPMKGTIMKNRKSLIAVIVVAVLTLVLWDQLSDFGAEIYRALT